MERQIAVDTHYMPGNTGIQLAVAHILASHLGIQRITYQPEDGFVINENIWEYIYPHLLVSGKLPHRCNPMLNANLYISGYFQDSVPLVEHRDMLLEAFRQDDHVISSHGYTLKEFMTTPSPIRLNPEDIVLHIRLGDFGKLVADPVPQIAILRRLQPKRLIIVCAKPNTTEENYLKLFEEFRPIFQHGTELEDFAVLREARRIMVTNSTFSWFAAFVGQATERWIPEPTYNALGRISETDTLYKMSNGYDLEALAIPTEPFKPVTGEFLQSLCDYTILNRAKKKEFHITIDYAHPPERQLFIEDEWSTTEARSIFVYPMLDHCIARHVFSKTWPNLKLIVFHNSDYPMDYPGLEAFLQRHPSVYVWAQNATQWHPRLRPLPIGEENRLWRGGNAEYEPMTTVSREDREIDILLPFWNNTSAVRTLWRQQALDRNDITFLPKLQKNVYLQQVSRSHALVCPPGNGLDTHRCWDAITNGAWAIVQDNAHTQLLLEAYPSLPLFPIEDMTCPIEIPTGLPPFHPMLLRPFWTTLFASHLAQA